jgi:hypothetical protein
MNLFIHGNFCNYLTKSNSADYSLLHSTSRPAINALITALFLGVNIIKKFQP